LVYARSTRSLWRGGWRARGRSSWAFAAPALLLAIVLVLPSALAGPTSLTLTAPFGVTLVTGSDFPAQSGIGVLNISTSPYFDGYTGKGGYMAQAYVPPCTGSCNASASDSNAQLYVELPIPLVKGATIVTMNWSLNWQVSVHLRAGSCHTHVLNNSSEWWCGSTLQWGFQIEDAIVYDKATNSWYGPTVGSISNDSGATASGTVATWGQAWWNSTGCSLRSGYSGLFCGSWGHPPTATTSNTSVSWEAGYTLPAMQTSGQYFLQVNLAWYVISEIDTAWATVHGFASGLTLNMATKGNGLVLNWMTVS
jgi:hypothetical protein